MEEMKTKSSKIHKLAGVIIIFGLMSLVAGVILIGMVDEKILIFKWIGFWKILSLPIETNNTLLGIGFFLLEIVTPFLLGSGLILFIYNISKHITKKPIVRK